MIDKPRVASETYRPDVDGLRAVAVLSVIFFHLRTGLLPGGYVGVDIFFVISGFLITRNICMEIEAGRFSLLEFYRRRVKRIMPAMLVVVFVVLVASQLLMLPDDAITAAKSALFSVLAMANVYFWRFQDFGYFATDSNQIPLLHLWSLGVEEQFYLAWPLLLMLFYRKSSGRGFLLAMLAAAIVSFFLGQALFGWDPSFSYYMLPTRAGELLFGAMVAIAVLRHVEGRVPRAWVTPMAAAGAVILLLTLVLLSEKYTYPGWLALLPTIGTSLLILSGHCGPSVFTRALSVRPMIWVGQVSYSAYLWHWPLLALYRYGYGEVGAGAAIIIFLLTFGLAWISYRYVEQPLRRSRAPALRVIAFQYAIPAVVLAVFALCLIYPNRTGVSLRSPHYRARLRAMQEEVHPAFGFDWVCQRKRAKQGDVVEPSCVLGSGASSEPTALLWGDSNASTYIKIVESFAQSAGFRFRNLEVGDCPPLDVDPAPFVEPRIAADCRASNRLMRSVVPQYKVVIMAASWTSYQEISPTFLPTFIDEARRLAEQGKLVILLAKVPQVDGFDRLCRQKALSYPDLTCDSSPVPVKPDIRDINAQLRRFAAGTPNVRFFDATGYICPNDLCSPLAPDGTPQYYDKMHLTVAASTRLGRTILSSEGVPKPFNEIVNWAR